MAQSLEEPAAPERVPPNVQALEKLLAEPDVQAWLRTHAIDAGTAHTAAKPEPSHSTRPSHPFADYVSAIRNHIYGLAAAMKDLPAQFGHAGRTIIEDIEESGIAGLLALIAILVVACAASGFIYRKATSGFRQRLHETPPETTWDRLSIKSKRYLIDIGEVGAMGIAGTAAFLALDYWPDVIEKIILAYLLAYIGWLLIRVTSSYLLRAENGFRIVPVSDNEAAFGQRQIGLLGALGTFGSATVLAICLLEFLGRGLRNPRLRTGASDRWYRNLRTARIEEHRG